MKKLRKVIAIILLCTVVIGLAGVLAGYVLGAKPLEIGRTIYEGLAAHVSFHPAEILPNLQTPAASPA